MSNTVSHELVQKSLVGEALEHGPMAIFVADDSGRYIAVNAYACELLGYTRDELLDLPLREVAVNPGAQQAFDELQLRTGTHAGLTLLRHRDGTDLPMHYRASRTTVGGMPLFLGICWPVDFD